MEGLNDTSIGKCFLWLDLNVAIDLKMMVGDKNLILCRRMLRRSGTVSKVTFNADLSV